MKKDSVQKVSKANEFVRCFKKNYMMYIFLIIPVAYFIIFKYIPMSGNVIAFRKFVPGKSYFGVEWQGFKYFKQFLESPNFKQVFFNTVRLSFITLLFSFPIPIIFALLLNEIHNVVFKRFVQSLTIIPRFLSTMVVVMIFQSILSPSNGSINHIINFFGGESIHFFTKSEWFIPIYVVSELWQFMGWSSIIYMAVLTSADLSQYEAAMVDGANRWKQTRHITMPLLIPTIAINLAIAVGLILNVSFEKVLLMYLDETRDVADVISTYVYRVGLRNRAYSYGTAIGLFQGVIGLVLLWITNKLTNKIWDVGLW